MYLSLPVPQPNNQTFSIYFVSNSLALVRFEVEMQKSNKVSDLLDQISKRTSLRHRFNGNSSSTSAVLVAAIFSTSSTLKSVLSPKQPLFDAVGKKLLVFENKQTLLEQLVAPDFDGSERLIKDDFTNLKNLNPPQTLAKERFEEKLGSKNTVVYVEEEKLHNGNDRKILMQNLNEEDTENPNPDNTDSEIKIEENDNVGNEDNDNKTEEKDDETFSKKANGDTLKSFSKQTTKVIDSETSKTEILDKKSETSKKESWKKSFSENYSGQKNNYEEKPKKNYLSFLRRKVEKCNVEKLKQCLNIYEIEEISAPNNVLGDFCRNENDCRLKFGQILNYNNEVFFGTPFLFPYNSKT
ncbi:hypothetical protein MHBO_002989, partial [Bonamia ostreae]